MKAESDARDTKLQDDDDHESRGTSETKAPGAVPSSGETGRSRLALSVVTVTIGILGFVTADAGFPNIKTVAFGTTSLIIASVIGCLVLVWKANRHDAIMSVIPLAGTLDLAFTVVYTLIHYREIYKISIRDGSSPSARKQALALTCGPVMAGLWFLLLGLGAMRETRKKGDGDRRGPEARERQKQEQGIEKNRRQS